ncbi:MAG: hypothetical protein IJY43_04075, partial [Clostridia bacterium]|nr:hypothetical protein [Clostridia bacterium]
HMRGSNLTVRKNGSIIGNYATKDGGAIYMESGTLTIDGGKLNYNTSALAGGAVYVKGSSTVRLNSGEMIGNKAVKGAAIYKNNSSGGTVELFDCTISENEASKEGAVWIPNPANHTNTVRLGGSVRITDNTSEWGKHNLFVEATDALSCIQIAKPLTDKASVGISFNGDAAEGRQIAQKSDDFEGDFDLSAQAFFLDEPVENMGAVISENLIVLTDVTATGCACEGGFTSGKGTVASPYKITSADQLRHVESHPEASYILVESIDLSSVGSWTPLCAATPFSGSFNGNGKTISGMSVNSGTVGGLFASVSKDAVIYNMTLSGEITVGSTMTHAGGLAAVSYGTVKQVTSNVNITVSADAANAEIGGVVGFNGGTVAFSVYGGAIKGTGNDCAIGAIIGHSKVTNTALLPTLITAHTGFGADSDSSSLKQDNTIDNVILSINYGPDMFEVDVRSYDEDGDGVITGDELRLHHDASGATTGIKLSEVLSLLAGTHERFSELNPTYAAKVRIQFDIKEEGLLDEAVKLAHDTYGLPYNRLGAGGSNTTAYIQENIEWIRDAMNQGMFINMNPDQICSDGYNLMVNDTEAFIAAYKALELPFYVVNSNYTKMTEQALRKLNDAGIQVSLWTLNSTDQITDHMLIGAYKMNTKNPESLVIREQLRTYGTMANDFSAVSCLPEVGLCSTTGIDERFESNHSFAYACSATCSVCGEANPDAQSCVGKVACADATCQWCGEEVVPVACKDINKDHICDYGCDVYQGSHADGEDTDHLCDYCNQSVGEACYDVVKDHKCDECDTEMNMNLHADGDDNNHLCDYCNQSVGEVCYDVVKDHKCDECGTEMNMNLHADGNDNDHLCDYCGQSIGETCYDDDKDHACDECGAEVGTHADVDTDDDHVCDYGCGEKLNDCTGGTATCKELAKCTVCGAEYGALAAHTPNADDGDCTTAVTCSVCNAVTTAAESAHTGGSAT